MTGRYLALSALLCASAFGCFGEPRTCGEGTVLEGDSCVPMEPEEVACGEGTTLVGGECVADGGTAPTCGPGTELVDGECVPDGNPVNPRECGPGTTRVGDECVRDDPAVSCGSGTVLVDGECVPSLDAGACVPDCLGRGCGDDGCGGTCGSCDDPALPVCDEDIGVCVAICVPQCTGRNCGDDGCGGTCGACDASSTCPTDLGRCVPNAWTCNLSYYGGGDICDCDCGAYDSDCDLATPLAGCEEQERCNDQGECVPKAPATWTCAPSLYGAVNACDCNCGAYDPDCDFTELVGLNGCGEGVSECQSDGSCGTCTPDCTDKVCGDDGCGGSCGSCDAIADETCHFGDCVERCGATPAACLDATCGDDGCGGSCGSCAAGSSCNSGQCESDPVVASPFSCFDRCGSVAPSGCYCTDNCASFGNCCNDFAEHCTCVPDCTGKACGSDGCGGSCGTCDSATPYCTDDGECTDACTPTCGSRACGPDGCGGSCGSCGADEVCYWTYQCVPEAWTCDGVLFGDQQGCDCGCGAVDPDCAIENTSVFGCPDEERVCGADGLCDIAFCHSQADCGGADWCTGAYAEGSGDVGGYCAVPVPDGDPPGVACTIHEECASLLCAGGLCREYCQDDVACPNESACVGMPIRDQGTRIVYGYAAVCEMVPGSRTPCSDQATCGLNERCIVHANATTDSPRYLCAAILELEATGESCDFEACPAGYRCEETAAGRVCTLPCPGGAQDCESGFACVDRPFAPVLDNGVTVPLCLPE